MIFNMEDKLTKIPVIKSIVAVLKRIKLPFLQGLSFYDLLELYFLGLFKGAFSYRAGAIAFSFFMALFPFTLFILNLIPYIPIEGFQEDFMGFIAESVPPTTFEAISGIITDILNNSYQGLLSTGFLLSIFLSANGINAILGGFEFSYHITVTRSFFKLYFISVILSVILSILLIITVASIVISEVFIQKLNLQDYFYDSITWIQISRFSFLVLMILLTTSFLFKYGAKQTSSIAFISIGSVFTTILTILSSYMFGIYVEKFAKYNELYGSIGTLLILMFYIWINCMILLLGFELNATIHNLKNKPTLNN